MTLRITLKDVRNANTKERFLKKICPDLQSIPIESEVMKQVGVNLCNLPEVDGFKHLIVLIDYFPKWSEVKPVKDKSAPTVAAFLYEVMCRHGCCKIQINDQGKEFVNEVSNKLLEMTGTEQRVTSAYHPQSNGLCESQNRTIKDSLVKILEENPKEWPNVIQGVPFAHRVSVHYSTKFLPFFLLYNRHPTLPINIKYNLVKESYDNNVDELCGYETFRAVLSSSSKIREVTHAKLAKTSKRLKRSNRKITTSDTAHHHQHYPLDQKYSYKTSNDRTGKEGS